MGTTCSSPNIPQPPRPFINVRLSTPSGTVFRPYSVVTGEIALTPITDIAPHAIEVSLIGQAVIWYRLRYSNNQGVAFYKHWRDNAPLFEATSNLLPISDSEQ
jgi:pyocin large subunit-like protein